MRDSDLPSGLGNDFPREKPKRPAQELVVRSLRALDEKAAIHERERATLSSLFRTLLHQLMTAQIRVHDLDLSALGVEEGAAL